MTDPIDLDALHFMVLRVLDYEIRTIPGDSKFYGPQRELDVADLQGARGKIAEAFAELTTRRARDAEVAELVTAASTLKVCGDGRGYFESGDDCNRFRAALRPFHPSGSDAEGESK